MRQYLDYLNNILINGHRQANRTGIDAISVPGAMMKFNLKEGFPVVTTKKLAFGMVKGELIGFLRGYDNAAQFRELGCKIWDQNANENKAWLANPNRKGTDDLGRIYGVQWRDWHGSRSIRSGELCVDDIDQVMNALNEIHNNPTNRRIIINAWRPDEFDQMALPPCHVLYQFLVNVERNELNLCMYQRSCDSLLGVPFNIASSALLLSLFARITGYQPGTFTHFLADAHIYVNHLDQVSEQLSRMPLPLPQLIIDAPTYAEVGFNPDLINTITPDQIKLFEYNYHPAISAPMAV